METKNFEFALGARTLEEGQQFAERILGIRMQKRESNLYGGDYFLCRFPVSDDETVEIRLYANGTYAGQRINGAYPPGSIILEIAGGTRAGQLAERMNEADTQP